jgi:hypothetical protein
LAQIVAEWKLAMKSIAETAPVTSALPDLRQVPLAEVLTPTTLDKALQRVIAGAVTAPVPVAAFSSAI